MHCLGRLARLAGLGQIHGSRPLGEHAEPLKNQDLAPGIHGGIGEAHALRAIDEKEELRKLADDFAMVQDRPAENKHQQGNGESAERRKQPVKGAGEAAGLAAIQAPGGSAEGEGVRSLWRSILDTGWRVRLEGLRSLP